MAGPALDPVVREVVEQIVRHCDPDRVVLFGSYARGTQTPLSDVDLLVVKETGLPPGQRGREIRQLFYTYPVRLDVLVHTPEEVAEAERRLSFLGSVIRQGVEVYRRVGTP